MVQFMVYYRLRAMRKILFTLLAVFVAGSTMPAKSQATDLASDSILVVFFSRAANNWAMGENGDIGWIDEGNTAVFARYICEYTGCKAFEILPKNAYPEDYMQCVNQANQERDDDARPALREIFDVDMSKISTVFIGSGVWCGQCPMIMRTFYETYASLFAGKRVIPFGTHEGSGISTLVTNIRNYMPSAVVDSNSKGFYGHDIRTSQAAVDTWLDGLNLPKKTATAIENISDTNTQTTIIYTIDGRYVGANVQNLSKGMYVVNGKKMIIE